MRSNDIMNRDQVRNAMQSAIQQNDSEAFAAAFDEMLQCIQNDIQADYEAQIENMRQENDSRTLTARGVRQLTSEERKYYTELAKAMKSNEPKQALANLGVLLPETVISAVFDDLRERHPLLSRINFIPVNGNVRLLMNTNGYQTAAWGKLCDEIVTELTSGFEEVDAGLLKLSAFLPVCKAMLELGPEWLDNYVRQVLYEALANGLEAGIVDGDGDEEPIGMTRQVGEGVSVVDGVYPQKEKIEVDDFSPATMGNLLSYMAVDANGKNREVRDLILLVSPEDYFSKILPATTVMAPDGTYRNDVLPYPVTIIQTNALSSGEAILGMGYRYFAAAGTSTEGRIDYSDHYHFLEDERVYLIKAFANGMPMDNSAFLFLDISDLEPVRYTVHVVDDRVPSDDATLSSLKIGTLTLSPAFDPDEDTYTAATTDASNKITAIATNAGAHLAISVGGVDVANGTAATWAAGTNTVTVAVIAEDGVTTETYTVTVTKS